MTTNWIDQWLEDTLRREGWPAFTDRVADRGGPTKGGITIPTLTWWRTRHGQSPPNIGELKNLSAAEAKMIYLSDYLGPWGWMGPDLLPLQILCADWSVTSGPSRPTDAIQSYLHVRVDGVAGPQTRTAVLRLTGAERDGLYGHVWQARLRYYLDIVCNGSDVRDFIRTHPTTQLTNLRGWVNRALELPALTHGGGREPIPATPGGAAGSPAPDPLRPG